VYCCSWYYVLVVGASRCMAEACTWLMSGNSVQRVLPHRHQTQPIQYIHLPCLWHVVMTVHASCHAARQTVALRSRSQGPRDNCQAVNMAVQTADHRLVAHCYCCNLHNSHNIQPVELPQSVLWCSGRALDS